MRDWVDEHELIACVAPRLKAGRKLLPCGRLRDISTSYGWWLQYDGHRDDLRALLLAAVESRFAEVFLHQSDTRIVPDAAYDFPDAQALGRGKMLAADLAPFGPGSASVLGFQRLYALAWNLGVKRAKQLAEWAPPVIVQMPSDSSANCVIANQIPAYLLRAICPEAVVQVRYSAAFRGEQPSALQAAQAAHELFGTVARFKEEFFCLSAETGRQAAALTRMSIATASRFRAKHGVIDL